MVRFQNFIIANEEFKSSLLQTMLFMPQVG
jgi:hypothetical protein